LNCYSTQREIKQVAKRAGDDPVTTFAWEFIIALATLNYWPPDGQLERLNKAKEELSLRAVTINTVLLAYVSCIVANTAFAGHV